jgi:hypothetical protein
VVVVPGSNSGGFNGDGYKPTWGSARPRIECRYFHMVTPGGAVLPGVGEVITDTSTLEEGDLVWLICRDVNTGLTTYEHYFPWTTSTPPVAVPPAAVLAQIAANTMVLPLPDLETWPSDGQVGLVHLPVWLHVDNWQPIQASASAGGLTATVEARPVRVTWKPADDTVVCEGPGTRFDGDAASPPATACTYAFERSSGGQPDQAFTSTAAVTWHLRWFATTGEGADLGELTGPSTTFSTRVQESHALVAASTP